MKTGDGPTFNGGDEERVDVVGVVFNKVFGGLFGGDGDEWDAFVGGFEPDDLWFFLLSVILRLGG